MNGPLRLPRLAVVLALAVSAAGSALAQAPAPAPSPAPAAEPPKTETPKAETPKADPPKAADLPKKIAVGTGGLFQPGLLLQGQYVYDQLSGGGITNTFRVRRAEIIAKGEIIPGTLSYQLMVDPARVREPVNTSINVNGPSGPETITVRQFPGAGSIFQDFFLTYLTPYAEISLGQFKIPVSWEAYNSTARLLLPERPMVSALYGDKRDVGIRVAKTFKRFGYSFGVFNGALLNNLDGNNSKDVALRLEAYPVDGLMLGAVGYSSIGERLSPTTRDRLEADARYERGPFLVQAEFIRGYDGGGAGRVTGQGFYGAAAYMVTDRIQPVLRVGYLDPNLAVALAPTTPAGADEAWEFTAGLNYYLQKHEAKLQLSYQRVQFDTKQPLNELLLQAQVWF